MTGWVSLVVIYPLKYIDPDGHVPIIPILIIAGVFILKAVDYGWTAYDAYQCYQILKDPNASQNEKDQATTNLAMTAAFELAEPDDVTPISLPLDDLARKGIISQSDEVVETFVETSGQWHHIISNKIKDELSDHQTLSGIFSRNDYLVQALDEVSHKGYQTWHNDYDDIVVEWLQNNPLATKEEFLDYLMDLYSNTDLMDKFPDAWELLQMALEELE